MKSTKYSTRASRSNTGTLRWLHCDVNEEGEVSSAGCHFNGTCVGVSSKGVESGQSLMSMKDSCETEQFRIWAEGTAEGETISGSHRIWLQHKASSKWIRMNDVLQNLNSYPPEGISPFQVSANGRNSCYNISDESSEKIGNPVADVVAGSFRANPLCARHRMRFRPFAIPQHRLKDGVYILQWKKSKGKSDWKCVHFPEEAADDVIDRRGPTLAKSKCESVPVVKRSPKAAPMVSPSNPDDESTIAFRVQWLRGDTYLIQAPRRNSKGEWMCLGFSPGKTVPVDVPHAVRLLYHWQDNPSAGFDETKQFSLATEICGLNFRDGSRPHNLNSALNLIYQKHEVIWRIRRVSPFEFSLESLDVSRKTRITKWRRVGFDDEGRMIREEQRRKRFPGGRFRFIPVDTRFEGQISIGPDAVASSLSGGGGGGGSSGGSGGSGGGGGMLPMGLRERRAEYERLLRQKDSKSCDSLRCKQEIEEKIKAIHTGVIQ